MKILNTKILSLLALACLSDCSSPVDAETQAKARAVSLAKAVREPKDNYANEEGQTSESNESNNEEPVERESATKDDWLAC